MTDIIIKPLVPELIEDYFDFFDNRAFSDGSPYYPCYCNAFNLSLDQIKTDLYAKAKESSFFTKQLKLKKILVIFFYILKPF